MKTIKEIHSQGFYVFSGRSNANSCFIEKLTHGKQFLVYANYFLKGYLKIHDYVINKDGWMMVVRINHRKTIVEKYQGEGEIWRIISERMRLFLSLFVRVTNRKKRRTGSLVHSSYQKMSFDNLKEALSIIDKLRKQQMKIYVGRKKYRGLKTHYKITRNGNTGSIFLCSKEIKKRKAECMDFAEVIDFIDLKKLVVEKSMDFTINLNKFNSTPSKQHKLDQKSP